jgi:hypothetical protein
VVVREINEGEGFFGVLGFQHFFVGKGDFCGGALEEGIAEREDVCILD